MKPFARMILGLSIALAAAGCVDIVTLDELIEKTGCDKVNSAHWLYYCGDENGRMYFRQEFVPPLPAKDYAVKSDEMPPVARFQRTDDRTKWKRIRIERHEYFIDNFGITAVGHTIIPVEKPEQDQKELKP